MLLHSNDDVRFATLEDELREAQAITPELMAGVIAQACTRYPGQSPAAKAGLDRLMASGAWTDAVLALLGLELPRWQLRRLVFDDGVWHCALSREPGLPFELDDMAEAVHENLPLAMLGAFLQARRRSLAPRTGSVPQVPAMQGHVVCCDNFA
jgi:hypothetical protein